MRNVFIFLLFIVGIWTGIEVMNHGMAGAFDGLFVDLGMAQPNQGPASTTAGRAAGRWEAAYDRAEGRVDDQVE
ncbi:MAG TPA: hypothetical protein VLC53_05990 [Myxococcota bacterium]|nr:hypothetical protein [Myxococcota bacterium]